MNRRSTVRLTARPGVEFSVNELLFRFGWSKQKIKADSISISYGMFHPIDVNQIHSVGASVILGGFWNPKDNLFRTMEIDMLSYGNPALAGRILERR